MAPAKASADSLLARVNFPLYALEMLSNRHVLVAGGGGAAKTGIANGFEIYEIHHNGKRFVADRSVRHETGTNSIMNCSLSSSVGGKCHLATGQEQHCQLYHIAATVSPAERSSAATDDADATTTRQRKKPAKESNGTEASASSVPSDVDSVLSFAVTPGDSVQTDFAPSDPLQRVARVSPNGKLLATAGLDAHIRVWSFPRLHPMHDLALHTDEVDDLDFSPDSRCLCSIGKDGQALLTVGLDGAAGSDGVQTRALKWTVPADTRYAFKRCRFAVAEGRTAPAKHRLFTIANPQGGKAGAQRGLLQLWDTERGRLAAVVPADESLSALAVRDDGRFVAVGTMFSGSVHIYVAFSLQKVLHVSNAHAMFVTGLEFLPVSRFGPEISSDAEAAVLSISVDNRVCIHALKPRHSIPVWLAVLLIVVALFITFTLCSIVGI